MTSLRNSQRHTAMFLLGYLLFATGCPKNPGGVKVWTAINQEDTAALQRYADAGGDLNVFNSEGFYPLYFAIWMEKPKSYQKLLELGANPNLNRKGRLADTVMHRAAAKPNTRWLELALAHKGDPNVLSIATPNFGVEPPLFQTCTFDGNPENARLLIEAGANMNVEDDRGKSFLEAAFLAGGTGHYKLVIYMLEKGADHKHVGKNGPIRSFMGLIRDKTPNQYQIDTTREACWDIIRWLEAHGVDTGHKEIPVPGASKATVRE